jgi:cytochrome c-type biogenesis protein CcsB
VAELSTYLFWTGFLFAALAFGATVLQAIGVRAARQALTAETGYGTVTVGGDRGAQRDAMTAIAVALGVLTALTLGGAYFARWSAVGHAPLSNLYEFTTAFAFGISVAHVAFIAWSRQVRFGLVSLPIVLVMLLTASLFPSEITPLVPALQDNLLLTVHVTAMMASYAILTVAFVGAVVYLVQGGGGRRRVRWLPGAEAAEELAHRAVIIGFPVLGLGIALGAFWANSAWGRYWGWDPKETSALVTWLALAAYFHARAGSGTVAAAPGFRRVVPARVRRGPRPDPMWWLIVTWGLVMFTYFGVNLWISGLHSYAGV